MKSLPPKRFTEDQLLLSMETAGKGEFENETEKKGLGTPATRAGIIEKLVSSGYAVRKGRQLLPRDCFSSNSKDISIAGKLRFHCLIQVLLPRCAQKPVSDQ